MKNLAIVTFDICRPEEPAVAFAIGSILAALKNHHSYGSQFEVVHFGYNLYNNPTRIINWNEEAIRWDQINIVAISCYVWSHTQALFLMKWLKTNFPEIKIIAGGYQINAGNEISLKRLYPHADNFIIGSAEKSLLVALNNNSSQTIFRNEPDWNNLPSPYTSGAIDVNKSVRNIRTETKRGCPFACTFCAQHEVGIPKTHYYLPDRLAEELEFIKSKGISRVSVTDPVFNMGKTYLPYLEEIKKLGLNGVFNFQVRPELISAKNDVDFLSLLADTKSEIELGIQTFDEEVNKIIKRHNNYRHIDKTLEMLIERDIRFGMSLIYGLPGQTFDSFQRDIEKLQSMGIENVVAFPLMVLPGTELFERRESMGIREIQLGEFQIPHVVESYSFSEAEWHRMHEMANVMNNIGRLF